MIEHNENIISQSFMTIGIIISLLLYTYLHVNNSLMWILIGTALFTVFCVVIYFSFPKRIPDQIEDIIRDGFIGIILGIVFSSPVVFSLIVCKYNLTIGILNLIIEMVIFSGWLYQRKMPFIQSYLQCLMRFSYKVFSLALFNIAILLYLICVYLYIINGCFKSGIVDSIIMIGMGLIGCCIYYDGAKRQLHNYNICYKSKDYCLFLRSFSLDIKDEERILGRLACNKPVLIVGDPHYLNKESDNYKYHYFYIWGKNWKKSVSDFVSRASVVLIAIDGPKNNVTEGVIWEIANHIEYLDKTVYYVNNVNSIDEANIQKHGLTDIEYAISFLKSKGYSKSYFTIGSHVKHFFDVASIKKGWGATHNGKDYTFFIVE